MALGSEGSAVPSPTTQSVAALMANPSYQNQIAGDLAGGAGAPIAGSALSSALAGQSLGLAAPGAAVSGAELGNQYGFDLANSALSGQGIGLQESALGEQSATNAAQQGIEEQQYGVSATQYPEQQAEAALSNKNTLESMSQQGASTGTLNTVGAGRGQTTQASEYGWQKADIFRNQQLAQLGQQSEEVGYQGQQEQTAASQAQLALAAQQNGISVEQATAQFGFGLQQIGVGAEPESYLNQIAQAQGAGAQGLAGIGSQAALIGGLGATSFG